MTTVALAAGTTLMAVAFFLSIFDRWLDRGRPPEGAWAVSLALFSLGALSLWGGAAFGWDGAWFRGFYLTGAILNVPFLALGTLLLLRPGPVSWRIGQVLVALAAFATGVLVSTPLDGTIDPDTLPQGSDVFGALPRVMAAVASGGGALVVFGGAAWSAATLVRTGRRSSAAEEGPTGAHRAAGGNALIALGAVVLSTSGLLNSVLGEMDGFAVTLAIGITILFAGFLVSTSGSTPRPGGVSGRLMDLIADTAP
ncbi:MAG: hypothetical protein GY929_11245 [Actinomycetia bacterium]|nr:hypothetical protein [Actinomycetes bacterium]